MINTEIRNLKFNKTGNNYMQIIGNYKGMRICGSVLKLDVKGNQKKVWQYRINITYDSIHIIRMSNTNEGTLWNDERLIERVNSVCEEEFKNKERLNK